MSDGGRIGGPPPGLSPQAPSVDQSFQDDMVGGQEKNREVKQKSARDLHNKLRAQQLAEQAKRVQEAQLKDGHDSVDDAKAIRASLGQAKLGAHQRVSLADAEHQGSLADAETLEHAEHEVASLLRDIDANLKALERALGAGRSAPEIVDIHALDDTLADTTGQLIQTTAELEGAVRGGVAELSQLLERTYARLKGLLRAVFAGEYGFKLLNDPHTSARQLFSKVEVWPTSIPPGRAPLSEPAWREADWDTFLAWLYRPPAPPPSSDLDLL